MIDRLIGHAIHFKLVYGIHFHLRVSRGSLPLVLGLTAASHVVGMAAVHFQIVYLYGVCFIINIVNGCVVFFFHTSMDTKVIQ